MKKYLKIVINGRFLTQKLTGVQRYALEITKALDSMIENESVSIELAVPANVENLPELKHIKTVYIGKKSGIIWEQTELSRYLN